MVSASSNNQSEQIGRGNRRLILKTILLKQPISRTAIARESGLTGASVSRITRDLIEAGAIRESDETVPASGPGRRFVSLEVNPDGGYLLSLSLNAFQQQVTLTDLGNRLVEQVDLRFKDLSDPDTVIDAVISAMATMSQRCRRNGWNLIGGAIAIAGAIDPVSGVIPFAPVMNWHDVPLGPRLEAALGIPFLVESLPNALNLAETRFGVATDCRNVLLVNGALGVGASLYLDGRLIRGTDHAAGLAGNALYPFPDAQGEVTLDEVAGGRAVIAGVEGRAPESIQGPPDEMAVRLLDIIDAADRAAGIEREWLRRTGQTIGKVASLYASLVHPKMIIFSGPLGSCPTYFEAAGEVLTRRCRSDCALPELVRSQIDSQDAARWLAVHGHLVDRDWIDPKNALSASG